MAQLRFAESAERDLADIGNFIARDDPVAAPQFIARIEQRCSLLALHPLSGRSRKELAPGLRSLAFGRYVIFYRALDDGVEIIRVPHGARDLKRALRNA